MNGRYYSKNPPTPFSGSALESQQGKREEFWAFTPRMDGNITVHVWGS
jgi:hypothetical protein